jgi:hypothetical protein
VRPFDEKVIWGEAFDVCRPVGLGIYFRLYRSPSGLGSIMPRFALVLLRSRPFRPNPVLWPCRGWNWKGIKAHEKIPLQSAYHAVRELARLFARVGLWVRFWFSLLTPGFWLPTHPRHTLSNPAESQPVEGALYRSNIEQAHQSARIVELASGIQEKG